jgi:hypothetical protein
VYILVSLLFYFTYIDAVDIFDNPCGSFSSSQDFHKVVATSKSEFVRPIKSCEISKPSDIAGENINSIVRACHHKLKRHYLIGFEKANYNDGRAFDIR